MATPVNKIEQYNKGTVFPSSYEETYIATKHISNRKLEIPNNALDELKKVIENKGLFFGDDAVLRNIIAGIIKGNVILQGPPGTGKTTLAKIICEVFNVAYTEATANSDWTTYDSIGGLQPTANDEGAEVIEGKNGYVVSSILDCCDKIVRNENEGAELQGSWLILDELNRCEIDKVFGDLFTALGTDSLSAERTINLWYQKDENKKKIYIPNRFRIIGAMNNVDKNFVTDISQGLSRRFTFIDILPPEEKYFDKETQNAKKIAKARVTEKIKKYGDIDVNNSFMQMLDSIDEFHSAEEVMMNFMKKVRYVHQDDDSYLGLMIGTAQIIDAYESTYISMIVSDAKDAQDKTAVIRDIVDTTLASRVVPQLDGFDFNRLSLFYEAIENENDFAWLKRTKGAIYKLIH